jgi:hypothetical protein
MKHKKQKERGTQLQNEMKNRKKEEMSIKMK